MNSRFARIDTGMGAGFVVSAVIHLTVFLLFVWGGQFFAVQPAIQETYYVDMVSLPTAAPQVGSADAKSGEAKVAAEPPAPPAAMALPKPAAVKQPSKPAVKAAQKSGKQLRPQESAESESGFEERLAKLEKSAEARREEEVFKQMQNKVKATGAKKGTPVTNDTEAGSRYVDYIKSRLEDALKITSSYSTRNPEVAVRLTIAADGRLTRMKIERSSGDVTFELAVRRAIDLASEKFTATPNHAVFENGFIFKPKGISHGTSR
jgi:colicin import membrane protein